MLYGLVVSYGPDILRDHRLAGTWQPAHDLQAMEGKCERKNFVITFCSAKIRSVANPSQAPIAHRFMMLFAGGGGESLVPVRSTTDRTAVSILYAAETKLWNRTLSFIFSAGILALFSVGALLVFWRALNHFDVVDRVLLKLVAGVGGVLLFWATFSCPGAPEMWHLDKPCPSAKSRTASCSAGAGRCKSQ